MTRCPVVGCSVTPVRRLKIAQCMDFRYLQCISDGAKMRLHVHAAQVTLQFLFRLESEAWVGRIGQI
jgi:hypothetical protein